MFKSIKVRASQGTQYIPDPNVTSGATPGWRQEPTGNPIASG